MTLILRSTLLFIIVCIVTGCTPSAPADPAANITRAWARATNIEIGSAYLTIQNPNNQALRLVSAETDAAPIVEIHAARVVNDVMYMGVLPDLLTIEAGQTIDFEESGYHLMLIDLPAALEVNDTITLTLTFELADGTQFTMTVDAPVAQEAPA